MKKNILFRNTGYLVIDEKFIRYDLLSDWFIQHQNDYIYITDKCKIIGVISGKEFENNLRTSNATVHIQKEYPYITAKENEITKVYEMFTQNANLLKLPIINDGHLVGEYYDTRTGHENTESNEIRSIIPLVHNFYDEIGDFFDSKGIHSLVIIVNKCENYIRETVKKISKIKISFSENYNNIPYDEYILDLKYPDEYRQYYAKFHSNVVLIFDVMSAILLKHFWEYCVSNNIRLIGLYAVGQKDISYLSYDDCHTISQNKTLNDILGDQNYLKVFYRFNKSYEYATDSKIGPLGNRVSVFNGIYNYIADTKSKYINVTKGVRKTHYVPTIWEKEIHFFGPCIAQGICVTDEYTIESYLQSELNEIYPNKFKVFNHGSSSHTPYASFCNDLLMAMDTQFHKGDYIIFLDAFTENIYSLLREYEITVIEDKTMFDGTSNYFLNNTYHCNHLANKKYADLLMAELFPREEFNFVKSKQKVCSCFQKKNFIFKHKEDFFLYNPDLKRYLNEISQYRLTDTESKKVGSIIMHANPFTKGHYSLVKRASREMDHVYVFIVQESINAIPFLLRKDIAEHVVRKLENVTVLSCGPLLGSYKTFPEYFTTVKQQGIFSYDFANVDIAIFGHFVCPALGIKYRYFGEEPYDSFTAQMNDFFKKELPKYGVIPVFKKRAQIGNIPISASIVRQLIKTGNYAEASKYCHIYTVQTLIDYYKSSEQE